MSLADGAIPSPNIWHWPDLYEIENAAVDPDGVLESTMRSIRSGRGATVLDIGCGTGFHLPRFAGDAGEVIGVEPHGTLVALAERRVAALPHVSVRHGSAQRLPVADASVDVVHARWAYFFAPGCEPGMREVDRVVRRGGAAFIVDNDPTRSTFGGWFARAHPRIDDRADEKFFARRGWRTLRREIRWSFRTRADFEAVVRIEFRPDLADRIIAEHAGTEVDYAVVVRVKEF